MSTIFQAQGLPLLIGSLPLDDHQAALDLVLRYTPEIPLWVQLPAHPNEGMLAQFLPGMPGGMLRKGNWIIDTEDPGFDEGLLQFYEQYLMALEGEGAWEDTRFCLQPETAAGFFVFGERLPKLARPPKAVKGQITGPFTFATGLRDQRNQAIFFDDRLRDAAVKLLAMKARWQVRQLAQTGVPVIIFIDEPALAGFGSSEFISVSREAVLTCLQEVIAAVQAEGGLAGVHVCANTDWALVMASGADIVNFDAYAYFERFMLYGEQVAAFMNSGGQIAWGIVPTLDQEAIAKEDTDSLLKRWQAQAAQVEALGISSERLLVQSLITPSCGMGALSPDQATRVLELTRGLADRIRRGA